MSEQILAQVSPHRFLNPEGWAPAKGYANGMAAEGKLVVTGGIIGWNDQHVFEHFDLIGQFEQVLKSIVTLLAEAGAGPQHLVRLTWYITDKQEYNSNLKAIGAVYRQILGRHFPAMAVVQVAGLMEDAAKIEIEATAIVPHA